MCKPTLTSLENTSLYWYNLSALCFRETLLGQLTVHIKSIQEDFSSKSGGYSSSEVPKGKNLPNVVNSIVWVNQLQAKVW